MYLKPKKKRKKENEIIGGKIGEVRADKDEFDMCFSTVNVKIRRRAQLCEDRAKVQPTEVGKFNQKGFKGLFGGPTWSSSSTSRDSEGRVGWREGMFRMEGWVVIHLSPPSDPSLLPISMILHLLLHSF